MAENCYLEGCLALVAGEETGVPEDREGIARPKQGCLRPFGKILINSSGTYRAVEYDICTMNGDAL